MTITVSDEKEREHPRSIAPPTPPTTPPTMAPTLVPESFLLGSLELVLVEELEEVAVAEGLLVSVLYTTLPPCDDSWVTTVVWVAASEDEEDSDVVVDSSDDSDDDVVVVDDDDDEEDEDDVDVWVALELLLDDDDDDDDSDEDEAQTARIAASQSFGTGTCVQTVYIFTTTHFLSVSITLHITARRAGGVRRLQLQTEHSPPFFNANHASYMV